MYGNISECIFSKKRISRIGIGRRRRLNAMEEAMVLALVDTSVTCKSRTLTEIGIPRRTYYIWVREEQVGGKRPVKRRPGIG
jgi:hypothetical protein